MSAINRRQTNTDEQKFEATLAKAKGEGHPAPINPNYR